MCHFRLPPPDHFCNRYWTVGDRGAVLRRRASTIGIGHRVHFIGHRDDLADVFHAADVTVLPSAWPETFGRVIIESMACGTPVVASRIGGIPEILTGEFAQGLVDPGDPQALAMGIQAMLCRRAADPSLSVRCRGHITEHFPLSRTISGVQVVLRQVVDQWNAGREGRQRLTTVRRVRAA